MGIEGICEQHFKQNQTKVEKEHSKKIQYVGPIL
jgi:hypothetical protein